jgi:hypothetical protein
MLARAMLFETFALTVIQVGFLPVVPGENNHTESYDCLTPGVLSAPSSREADELQAATPGGNVATPPKLN